LHSSFPFPVSRYIVTLAILVSSLRYRR